MSTLFISHSSKDKETAADMLAWLKSKGYESVFLSSDPVDGIHAGVTWEQELYKKLHSCRAMIVLLSEDWLASCWCFAEVTQARMTGKAVFPVKIAACDATNVFQEIQAADLTADRETGFLLLEEGLKHKGLDPNDLFDWDGSRPPYPGFEAFQRQDAAIFFGREGPITDGIATLNRLRRSNDSRFLLVLGASGSGKSSVVRAGLLPRLWKDAENWLPVEPFRPTGLPVDNLARALASSYAAIGKERHWREIRSELLQTSVADPTGGRALVDQARDLLQAASRGQATALLVIDQFEELFTSTENDDADRFLRLLSDGLVRPDTCLVAMATMRSDSLGKFQTARASYDLAYEPMTVDTMPADRVPIIIEGPAKVDNLELSPGLVAKIERDITGSNALPLLAFTLRQLYEIRGDRNRLELDEYDKLGGIVGAVQRKADDVISSAGPTDAELSSLRTAFIPWMVSVNSEGHFVRRRARRADLPSEALPLLDRFVEARLLVAGADGGQQDSDQRETLEIAHEALLQAWPRLTGWLNGDDGENLRLLQTVRNAALEWGRNDEDEQLLVHRDKRLEDIEALVDQPGFGVAEPSERAYLQACLVKSRADKHATLRYRIGTAAAVFLALLASAVLTFFIIQERGAAKSRELAALSKRCVDSGNTELGIRLALSGLPDAVHEGENEPDTPEAGDALKRAILLHHEILPLDRHRGAVLSAEFSPDGNQVLTTSEEDPPRVWDAESGDLIHELRGHHENRTVYSAIFSRDGKHIVTASADGTARLWHAATGEQILPSLPHDDEVLTAELSRNGKRVLTVSADDVAYTWDVETLEKRALIEALEDGSEEPARRPLYSAVFDADGARVLTTSSDHIVRIWDAASGQNLGELPDPKRSTQISTARPAPDGERIVTATYDGLARIWSAGTNALLHEFDPQPFQVDDALFSPDGEIVATRARAENMLRVWDAADGLKLPALKHESSGGMRDFDFARAHEDRPRGQLVVTASTDKTARVWRIADGESHELAILRHAGEVIWARFSADGLRVITASVEGGDGIVRLWWCRTFENFSDLLSQVERYKLEVLTDQQLQDHRAAPC